ncbi:MAG TPA: HlyD family efflux transporter periplasmic adaptor subunit, partial [Bacillota bacterium]|nr:HlyD family efflux transporter periplasmic adaptor subunit [Bacillota bacterium]
MTHNGGIPARRKRRLRPLRRILLLITAGLLVFGLFKTVTLTYSRVFGDRVQVFKAEGIAISPLHLGVGVILRDEVVVVAPRPGTLNAMVQSAAEVLAGDDIVEIVDPDRLAEIERLIAAEEAKLGGPGQDSAAALADAESSLRQATQGLRELTLAYASAMRQGDVSRAASLFPEIGSFAAQVYQYDTAFQLALGSADGLGSQYEELLEQRATTIYKVVAPVSGFVTWVVDEVSGVATPKMAPALALDLIANRKPLTAPLASGSHVAGGSAMCAIIDPATMTLVIEMEDAAWNRDEPITVRINGGEVDLDMWKSTALTDKTALYYFKFMSVSRELVDSRWVDVEIWPVREAAFSVPAAALTHIEGTPSVYALDEEG